MKNWLYVGAKVVALKEASHNNVAPKISKGTVLTVAVINTSPANNLCLGFEELPPAPAEFLARWPEARGLWHYWASEFGPVLPDTSKQIEALKQMMRDHVDNASGGLGIRKVRA